MSIELYELAKVESVTAVSIFKEGGFDILFPKIKKAATGHIIDIETKAGRAEGKSWAYKVTRSKTFLQELGLKEVKEDEDSVKAFKKEMKRVWNAMEELANEIKAPIIAWENTEKERAETIMASIEKIQGIAVFEPGEIDSILLKEKLDLIQGFTVTEEKYNEFTEEATIQKDIAIKKLSAMLEDRLKYEAEQAELAKLRKESEERKAAEEKARIEREQKERDGRLKKEAAEVVKVKAEAAKKKAEAKAKAERDRIEQEKQTAIEAREKAERDAKEAAEKAERDKLEAAEAAKIAEQKAVDDEKARIETERLAKIEAEEARQADKEHRAKIHREAARFITGIHGTTEEQAHEILNAISYGDVPHVKITY